MGFWIQEYGQATGANRIDWKMFHCDNLTDIANLPTQTTKGVEETSEFITEETLNYTKPGDQCFCLEDGSVWELGYSTNTWKKI